MSHPRLCGSYEMVSNPEAQWLTVIPELQLGAERNLTAATLLFRLAHPTMTSSIVSIQSAHDGSVLNNITAGLVTLTESATLPQNGMR
jgi:hypothetical protein